MRARLGAEIGARVVGGLGRKRRREGVVAERGRGVGGIRRQEAILSAARVGAGLGVGGGAPALAPGSGRREGCRGGSGVCAVLARVMEARGIVGGVLMEFGVGAWWGHGVVVGVRIVGGTDGTGGRGRVCGGGRTGARVEALAGEGAHGGVYDVGPVIEGVGTVLVALWEYRGREVGFQEVGFDDLVRIVCTIGEPAVPWFGVVWAQKLGAVALIVDVGEFSVFGMWGELVVCNGVWDHVLSWFDERLFLRWRLALKEGIYSGVVIIFIVLSGQTLCWLFLVRTCDLLQVIARVLF